MHTEIPKAEDLAQRVFAPMNENAFLQIALDVYHFQFANNSIYRSFAQTVGRTPGRVQSLEDIPFLPIAFFKTHEVRATAFEPEAVFTSSGTTGAATSRHCVRDLALYRQSFREAFRLFYGDPRNYCILGLLPSYLERSGSSLVYMVDDLVRQSGHPDSGFYLHDHERLAATLRRLEANGQRTLLLGVTYALLDFAQAFPATLKHTLVMETGGMKGRKREPVREELYAELREAFGVSVIHSEYGMTELLSQAYALDGRFRTPPWMRLLLRDETDPLSLLPTGGQVRTGALNVIDLANLYSCSFIATEDVGRSFPDGSFGILGRMDHSDVRGCSLLAV